MPSLASLWCNSAQADCTVKSCLACCAPLTERSSFFGCRDFLVNIFATTLRIWRGLLLRQLEDASFLDNKGLIYLYLNVIFYFLAEDSRSPEVGIRSYYFFYHGATAPVVQDLLIIEDSWSPSVRHITLGRTPLDEWSARRRVLYLTTYNTHKRQTSTPVAGFEPIIPTSEQPQTHALDRAAIGIGIRSC